jgi:hypothetical protein
MPFCATSAIQIAATTELEEARARVRELEAVLAVMTPEELVVFRTAAARLHGGGGGAAGGRRPLVVCRMILACEEPGLDQMYQ